MKKGQTASDEARAKMSAAKKGRPGRPQSPETREKIAKKLTGQRRSDETRARISESQKGKRRGPHTPERRKNISKKLTGRRLSPEQCEAMSAARKGGRWVPPSLVDRFFAAIPNEKYRAKLERQAEEERPRKLVIVRSPIPPLIREHTPWTRERPPAVVIRESDGHVIVRGKDKGLLYPAEYRVLRALLAAGPEGWTLKEMNERCTMCTTWRKTLRKLRDKGKDWKEAILTPRKGWPGKDRDFYRIAIGAPEP
jgi:hypothetical protein